MKNIVRKNRTKLINSLFRQKSLLWIFRIHQQMNMRMVRCIVESGVPFQIAQRNFRLLRNVSNVPHDQFTPSFGVIIAKTNRILTAQRDNVRPHVSGMICNFICSSVKHNRFIAFIEKSMGTALLNARTHCHVTDKILTVADYIRIALNNCADQFRGIFRCGIIFVILKFQIFFCFGKIRK